MYVRMYVRVHMYSMLVFLYRYERVLEVSRGVYMCIDTCMCTCIFVCVYVYICTMLIHMYIDTSMSLSVPIYR